MVRMIGNEVDEPLDDEFLFYSHLYSSITVAFAMAVLSKFFTNELRFGFRSFLSLTVVFIGEPACHLLMRGPSGVILFGLACIAVYSILPASYLPAAGKHVLITGCDSGFGNALAKELDGLGMVVYAGCLSSNSTEARQLKEACSSRLNLVQLDVTKESQVGAALDFVQKAVGSEGLWAVVNNAGIWSVSDIEMTSEKVFRQVLDVNLFGVMRVTKSFLPLLHLSKGRVVIMSSIAGRIPFEYFGAYCVSKSALEMYSDVLRLEMNKADIFVSVIEPLAFKTGAVSSQMIANRRTEVYASLDEALKSARTEQHLSQLYSCFESTVSKYPIDLSPVVAAMTGAILSKSPRYRYSVGRGANTLLSLYAVLPTSIADKLSSVLSLPIYDTAPKSQ